MISAFSSNPSGLSPPTTQPERRPASKPATAWCARGRQLEGVELSRMSFDEQCNRAKYFPAVRVNLLLSPGFVNRFPGSERLTPPPLDIPPHERHGNANHKLP